MVMNRQVGSTSGLTTPMFRPYFSLISGQ